MFYTTYAFAYHYLRVRRHPKEISRPKQLMDALLFQKEHDPLCRGELATDFHPSSHPLTPIQLSPTYLNALAVVAPLNKLDCPTHYMKSYKTSFHKRTQAYMHPSRDYFHFREDGGGLRYPVIRRQIVNLLASTLCVTHAQNYLSFEIDDTTHRVSPTEAYAARANSEYYRMIDVACRWSDRLMSRSRPSASIAFNQHRSLASGYRVPLSQFIPPLDQTNPVDPYFSTLTALLDQTNDAERNDSPVSQPFQTPAMNFPFYSKSSYDTKFIENVLPHPNPDTSSQTEHQVEHQAKLKFDSTNISVIGAQALSARNIYAGWWTPSADYDQADAQAHAPFTDKETAMNRLGSHEVVIKGHPYPLQMRRTGEAHEYPDSTLFSSLDQLQEGREAWQRAQEARESPRHPHHDALRWFDALHYQLNVSPLSTPHTRLALLETLADEIICTLLVEGVTNRVWQATQRGRASAKTKARQEEKQKQRQVARYEQVQAREHADQHAQDQTSESHDVQLRTGQWRIDRMVQHAMMLSNRLSRGLSLDDRDETHPNRDQLTQEMNKRRWPSFLRTVLVHFTPRLAPHLSHVAAQYEAYTRSRVSPSISGEDIALMRKAHRFIDEEEDGNERGEVEGLTHVEELIAEADERYNALMPPAEAFLAWPLYEPVLRFSPLQKWRNYDRGEALTQFFGLVFMLDREEVRRTNPIMAKVADMLNPVEGITYKSRVMLARMLRAVSFKKEAVLRHPAATALFKESDRVWGSAPRIRSVRRELSLCDTSPFFEAGAREKEVLRVLAEIEVARGVPLTHADEVDV